MSHVHLPFEELSNSSRLSRVTRHEELVISVQYLSLLSIWLLGIHSPNSCPLLIVLNAPLLWKVAVAPLVIKCPFWCDKEATLPMGNRYPYMWVQVTLEDPS